MTYSFCLCCYFKNNNKNNNNKQKKDEEGNKVLKWSSSHMSKGWGANLQTRGSEENMQLICEHLFPYCTFSSKALWCSNKDFNAFRTSTSLETPEGDCAWRFTTVILSDLSCLETRHSKCSSNSCFNIKKGSSLVPQTQWHCISKA